MLTRTPLGSGESHILWGGPRPYNTGMAIRPNHLDRWRHRVQGWHHAIWSNNGVSRPCDKTIVKLSTQLKITHISWTLCLNFNPRPAGVWIVTRHAGGRGAQRPPSEISQTTGPISKFQTPFDSPVRELPVQGQKFDPEVTDDVTGQVSQNFRLFGLGDIGE